MLRSLYQTDKAVARMHEWRVNTAGSILNNFHIIWDQTANVALGARCRLIRRSRFSSSSDGYEPSTPMVPAGASRSASNHSHEVTVIHDFQDERVKYGRD